MQRTLILAAMLLLAGCVEPVSTTLSTDTVPTASAVDENETMPAPPPEVTIAFDVPNVTKAESATLFVNSTGPVLAVVTVEGIEALREDVETATTSTVSLTYGRNEINVTLSAGGLETQSTYEIVRLGMTTVQLDFGVFHPASNGMPRSESFDVWVDVDARPSAPAYAAEGIANMDAFTAHDQLILFEQTTGKKVVYEFFPSFQGFGVSRIDGAGSAVSSDAPPWWCYEVNGGSADGISIQPIVPGDVASWALGSCTG